MMEEVKDKPSVKALNVPLDRDLFLRSLIRELSGTLEEVVGIDEAAGFVSVVGQKIGRQMARDYQAALGVESLTCHQVAEVLVDLKRRIQGDFFILAEADDKLVLGNRVCPFAEAARGREYFKGEPEE